MRMNLGVMVLVSAAMALLGTLYLFVHQEPGVVFFDSKVIRAALVRQLAERNAPDAEAAMAASRMRDVLPRVLGEYARKHHVVVLPREVLLAGGRDVTGEVMPLLAKAMREKS